MAIRKLIPVLILLYPITSAASFIESTIGTAVVNDATAALHNPASLVSVKNLQFIGLDSLAYSNTHFRGQTTQVATGFVQSGSASSDSRFQLPSLYIGVPVNAKLTAGMAIVANDFSRSIDDASILRYAQSSNSVESVDVIPALGLKINNQFAIGAGINVSYAKFTLEPITGFPTLNIPDSTSLNKSDGSGYGYDLGLLWRPHAATVLGFNYRSSVTYHQSGSSTFNGTPSVSSNHYFFTLWTPARAVLSANHFVTPKLGLMGTIQYIQWDIFNHINVNGVATQTGIVNGVIPFHSSNSWLLTLGSNYRFLPYWIVRVAATYIQSPDNPAYQLSNGDSYVIGASTGYTFNKTFTVDASYAHAFINNADVHITNARNTVIGSNSSYRNAIGLKLTINV